MIILVKNLFKDDSKTLLIRYFPQVTPVRFKRTTFRTGI